MRTVKLSVLTYMVVFMTYIGCAGQSDLSTPKEWSFETEKVWEMQKAGEDELLRPAEPRVADDGTLYFHDFERHVSYIIGSDGNLIGTFASRGEGEGEVPMYLNCFPAGDHVVVCAMDKLHFFTREGQFVKAVPNNPFVRFPLAFKDENEFWVAPGALGDSPENMAVVTHINLATGEETNVHKFIRTGDEKKPTGGGVVIGLTPQIKGDYDQQSERFYFGKNSDTLIYVFDSGGDRIGLFSFSGVRQPVSEEEKRNHFAKFDLPEEAMTAMVGALPDQMAYYNRIYVIDGLVYLLSSDKFAGPHTSQNVNVYSPDGRHLYHGRINVEEGWHIAGNTDNMQLARGAVFAVLENDTGEKKIVKYQVTLPRS
jgi:hypothetical protein